MEKRKLYATLEANKSKKVKLLNREDLGDTYNSLLSKIRQKFKLQISDEVTISARVEEKGMYVEVEEDDDDLSDVLSEARELRVSLFQDGPRGSQQLPPELGEGPSTSDGNQGHNDLATTENQSEVLDISYVLAEHPKGGAVMEEYERNKTLTPSSRMNLVSIVCAGIVDKHGYYPTPEEKSTAAKGIVQLFPNLRDNDGKTGYEHFFSAEGGQSGYIQSRMKNIRRHLPTISKQRPRKSSSQPSECEMDFEGLPWVESQEARRLADFCKNLPVESQPAVLSTMKRFTGNRIKWIRENSPPFSEILREYPHYLEIPELILQDFEQMYGDQVANNFLMKWGEHSRLIWKYIACSTNSALRDLQCEFEETEKSEEHASMYGLFALVHLLPSFNTRKSGKCSRDDNVRYFIVWQPIGTNVEEYAKKSQLSRKQPHLLAIGSNVTDLQQFFVVLDGVALPVSRQACGIVAATDILMKVHYVFIVAYAVQLTDFYTFIQTVVYGIPPSGQKISNRVKEIRIALQNVE